MKKTLPQKRKNLLDLRGKILFAPGYDHEALREDRPAPEPGDKIAGLETAPPEGGF